MFSKIAKNVQATRELLEEMREQAVLGKREYQEREYQSRGLANLVEQFHKSELYEQKLDILDMIEALTGTYAYDLRSELQSFKKGQSR